mgnify:CR=1 FL=1
MRPEDCVQESVGVEEIRDALKVLKRGFAFTRERKARTLSPRHEVADAQVKERRPTSAHAGSRVCQPQMWRGVAGVQRCGRSRCQQK